MTIHKKVLVLCQRKAGLFFVSKTEGQKVYKEIEVEIVPKINDLTQFLLGADTEIEYLSSLEGEHAKGKVDIKGVLSLNNSENLILNYGEKGEEEEMSVQEFINQRRGTYALIILQTCPFMFMDFNIIAELLSSKGLMVFSAFPRPFPSTFKLKEPERLFRLDEDLMERLPDPVQIYTKIKTSSSKGKKSSSAKKSGGKRTKKRRKFKKSKKLRHKTRR